MRTYIAGRRAVTAQDVVELALGTPVDLWLGVDGESGEERAARLAAARDILADEPHMPDRALAVVAETSESHPHLFDVSPPTRPTRAAVRRGAPRAA